MQKHCHMYSESYISTVSSCYSDFPSYKNSSPVSHEHPDTHGVFGKTDRKRQTFTFRGLRGWFLNCSKIIKIEEMSSWSVQQCWWISKAKRKKYRRLGAVWFHLWYPGKHKTTGTYFRLGCQDGGQEEGVHGKWTRGTFWSDGHVLHSYCGMVSWRYLCLNYLKKGKGYCR